MPSSEPFRSVWRSIAGRLQVPADRKWLALVSVSVLAGLAGVLAAVFFDPERTGWFPKCLLHSLTGIKCPGCGTARAVHAAAHGHWHAAFRFNAILFVAVPFLILLLLRPDWARKPVVAWSVFAVTVLWMLARNLLGW